MKFDHKSVLLQESIEGLDIKANGIYVDCTTGGGGHSLEIAKRLETGRLICIDQDQEALDHASQVLEAHGEKVIFIKSNFSEIDVVLDQLGIDKIDGALMDIGVSSYQFDNEERGFSYRQDARLDMRMDRNAMLDAHEVVNHYSKEELENIFWKYGEEKWGRRIAEFIIEARQHQPIDTTNDLVEIIRQAIPKKVREQGGHPARKVFQALRIEVNGELDALEKAIDIIAHRLTPGGRLAIITFHSLEDRIVKNAFRDLNQGCICPPDFPICICKNRSVVDTITRKPTLPKETEIAHNHRARSAKLRIAKRIE